MVSVWQFYNRKEILNVSSKDYIALKLLKLKQLHHLLKTSQVNCLYQLLFLVLVSGCQWMFFQYINFIIWKLSWRFKYWSWYQFDKHATHNFTSYSYSVQQIPLTWLPSTDNHINTWKIVSKNSPEQERLSVSLLLLSLFPRSLRVRIILMLEILYIILENIVQKFTLGIICGTN